MIVSPGIDGLICGVAQDAGTGASLGFYGEFYDAPCQVAASGDDGESPGFSLETTELALQFASTGL